MNKNFKQLWNETKKRILKESKKTNPWAVCHSSVKGEEEGGEATKKFERCVKDVKKEKNINEQITTLDKPSMLKKPTESEEDRKKREAEEKQRAMVSGIVEQDDEVETTASEHPIADPTGINSLEAEDIPIAETYKNKLTSLENKKAKLHEQLKALEEEMQKTRVIGEKKAAYESARESVAKLKEELDAFKNGDIPMDEDKIPGGLADDMTNADIAKKHGVDKKVIDKQVKIGKDVEAEHTPDEEAQKEIAQDHEVEDPEYYDDPDGLDLGDVEAEAEKEKKNKIDEGKKKSDKDLMKKAKYDKKKEDIKKHGASEDPHKPTQTIEDKKSKGKKAKGKHGTREAGKKAAREAMLKENKQKYFKEAWKKVGNKTDTDGFISIG